MFWELTVLASVNCNYDKLESSYAFCGSVAAVGINPWAFRSVMTKGIL